MPLSNNKMLQYLHYTYLYKYKLYKEYLKSYKSIMIEEQILDNIAIDMQLSQICFQIWLDKANFNPPQQTVQAVDKVDIDRFSLS